MVKQSLTNIFKMLLAAVLLIGLSSTLIYFSQVIFHKPPVSIIRDEQEGIVPYDQKKEVFFSAADLNDKTSVTSKIITEARSYSPGISFFEIDVKINDILSLLSPNIPAPLLRSIEGYFFGAMGADNFLILSTDSPDLSYSGMMDWEKDMADIWPLFVSIEPRSYSGFSDQVIDNKDIRTLSDNEGNTVFVYGFYNKNVIILAKNESVFKNIYDILLRQSL